MRAWPICAILLVAAACSFPAVKTAVAQTVPAETPAVSSNAASEINITRDSAPGRRPLASQSQQVIKAANDYFSLVDQEQYERAYAMVTEIDRRSVPLQEFVQQSRDFHQKSGALQRRDILKVTWTKDSATAPLPGVYAAIDVASRFANMDRHCGYIVLYQKPAGGDFEVMREESNFIDNATAQTIEQKKSRSALDAMWAKLAVNCPNYKSTSFPAPLRNQYADAAKAIPTTGRTN